MSRILVIDDNELIARMLHDALTEHGYVVYNALDANQGYAAAVEHIPDLIILDVQLPDVTGFDLCRILKNNANVRDIPIIMVTGTARSTEEKVKGFQMGIDDYLLKPFELPELLERVRAVLRRRDAKRSPPQSIGISPEAPASVIDDPASVPRLSLQEGISTALLQPLSLPKKIFLPGISFFFLMTCMTLALSGYWCAAGMTPSPAIVALGVILLWAVAVCVLVMGGSMLGLALLWKEGAGILSLALSPLLLKALGAFLFSACTTLSPFRFSAGIPLLWNGAPAWLGRIDLFEIWSAVLLLFMVRRLPQSSARKAGLLAFIVWLAVVGLGLGLARVGAA